MIMMSSYILLGDVFEHLFKYRKISRNEVKFLKLHDRSIFDRIISSGMEKSLLSVEENEITLLKPIELLLLLEELIAVDIEKLARYIEWDEFERYVAEKLRSMGLDYVSSYKHNRIARFQIDVLALDLANKIGYIIECKHWKKSMSTSQIRQVVESHLIRVEKLLKNCEWITVEIPAIRRIKYFIPLIFTLYAPKIHSLDGIPIVAIRFLNEFLAKIDMYIDLLEIKKYGNACYSL
jgi:hypothetical protein